MQKKPLCITRAKAGLVVVDIQERLLPLIFEKERLVQNTVLLLKGAAILGLDGQAQDGSGEKSVGYNGEYESKSGVLKSVRIGRLSLESASASFWPAGTGHDKAKFQMNIGNGFFKDYLMTFDFRGKIVVFEEPED